MLIIGDVGGTNCRLAVCDPSTGLIDEIRIMPVSDFRSLEEAINTYRDALPSYKFLSASISIANPITGDRIAMTNAHWDFSIEQTRKSSHLEGFPTYRIVLRRRVGHDLLRSELLDRGAVYRRNRLVEADQAGARQYLLKRDMVVGPHKSVKDL